MTCITPTLVHPVQLCYISSLAPALCSKMHITVSSQNVLLVCLWCDRLCCMLCRYLKNRSVIVTTVRCVLLVFLTCLVPAIVEGSDAPPSRFIDSSGLWPLVVISLGLLVRQHVACLEALCMAISMYSLHVLFACVNKISVSLSRVSTFEFCQILCLDFVRFCALDIVSACIQSISSEFCASGIVPAGFCLHGFKALCQSTIS